MDDTEQQLQQLEEQQRQLEHQQLTAKLAEIEVVIADTLARLQGLLPPEQIDVTLAPLRQQQADFQAQLLGSGALAQGKDAKALGQGAIDAASATIEGSLVTGAMTNSTFAGRDLNLTLVAATAEAAEAFWRQFPRPALNLKEATKRYLNYLAGRYVYLDFKGMGANDQMPLRLPLADMYVPLKARIEMPKGETWARELKLAGRQVSPEEAEAMGARLSEPQAVLTLVAKHDGLIILGDPGAGKTTFLKHLALQLALGQDMGLGTRLPILLPLAAYANALAKADVPLHRFIASYYENLGIDEPLAEMLSKALDQGGALLLLDGLDEVQNLEQRSLVIDRVLDFFTYRRQQGNKFILTSRIVGYRDVRPTATDMAECTLVDFDDEEIELFITKWTTAVEQQAQASPQLAQQEALREKQALLESVQHNPGVRRLASNPLLLTILALMKRQGVVLPNRRVELYDRYVTTLLKHWNIARGLGRPPTRDLDVVETIRVLAPLALWIHETNPGVGLVKREDVRRKLVQIYEEREMDNPEELAKQLLEDAHKYANLLLERGSGQYGFIHLTFQEYLAAVAIAQRGQEGIQPIVALLADHVDDDTWREVILLTIGHIGLIQQLDERAGLVLTQLVEMAPGSPGEAVILAGEAVADVGASGVTAACRKVVQTALLATLGDDQHVPPQQRIRAGQTLARVSDPRPEVMTTAGMRLCLIPRGPFWMGSSDEDEMARDNEKPQHQVTIPYDYWLSQFPVTNAQFSEFVTAGGYKIERYWLEAQQHGQWEKGQVTDWQGGWRERPYDWGYRFNFVTQPVVGVTWYESLAFCRWLSEQIPSEWAATLPSEAEWEKGSRGGLDILPKPVLASMSEIPAAAMLLANTPNLASKRQFPWSENEFKSNWVNHKENADGPSALGCFPGGTSPYGLFDMSGNVWEWTRTLWGKKYKYPYHMDDGREELGSSGSRVLRGGSWRDDPNVLRCAYRINGFPYFRGDFDGFRVCVRPHFPASGR